MHHSSLRADLRAMRIALGLAVRTLALLASVAFACRAAGPRDAHRDPARHPARSIRTVVGVLTLGAVIGGGLTHDGDPRLVRHIGNMALKTDRLGPRPVKEHRGSPRSIDLGICAVGAYDRATHHAAQPVTTFRSNYEDGGLTFAGR